MRLIDVDTMNEELFYKQLGGKDTLITAESAFNMIKAQPTAYDVEKVVAELVEADSGYCWMCGGGIDGETAIEIVKAGGIK
jgi:hypothetical protein